MTIRALPSLFSTLIGSLALTGLITWTLVQAHADFIPSKKAGHSNSISRLSIQSIQDIAPKQQVLKTLRHVSTPSLESFNDVRAPAALTVAGTFGGPVVANTASVPLSSSSASTPNSVIQPKNYGSKGTNNVNHYTDSLVPLEISTSYPYRAVGWFVFRNYDNSMARCSAALISNSILLTAGHCVHNGGGGDPYWISEGVFYPAYANGTAPYGYATANTFFTTRGWYNTGALNKGYDIAIVVLNKRSGTSYEVGNYTGTLGVCHTNCLQRYWYLTQLGYPGNYYDGEFMTMGQHLEYTDNKDYRAGSGMQGGASGGPHIANLGSLQDSSAYPGSYIYRNIVFAVTSWKYNDESVKIIGNSSTSGPRNGNNFVSMYNSACALAQALHGASSCKQIP